MKKNKKWLILVLCLMAGTIWQATMTEIEKNKYKAVGKTVNVGTYQAHYYTKGSGEMAFIFITGSGTPCAYTDFFALQNMLSTKGQTVTFDHAGSGWSSSTNASRTIDNMTEELNLLIDTVAAPQSIILICHSLGSLEAIHYTQTHPEKVQGIIFLDCGSPEFYRTDSELLATILNRGTTCLRTIGFNRLMGELGYYLPLYGEHHRHQNLPENIKEIDKAMFYRFAGNADSLNAIHLMNENAETVLNGPLLGEVPILVLSSDSGKDWNKVQIQLASWSKNSEQVVIKKADHYLYWSNDQEVSAHIVSFIDKIAH